MTPALACVSKQPLLPPDAMLIVAQFLRQPTPSGRIVLAHSRPYLHLSLDICRWMMLRQQEQEGHGGRGIFVTSKAFSAQFCAMPQVFQMTHKTLGYRLHFCGYCYGELGRCRCGSV